MMRRAVCLVVLVCAVAACEHKSVGSAGGALIPSRAAAIGEFPDNPLLAFVPADTPYAFASFKPVPLDVIRSFAATFKPAWRRMMTMYTQAAGSGDQARAMQDAVEALDTLDVKTFEDHGFSSKARTVFYGLGAYPVFRVELSNGDRVAELVQRLATRWNAPLPAPTERAGRRYWTVDVSQLQVFVAIAPKEAIVAVAPRRVIDANLPALLGEQRVANSLAAAQFRAIAERDGFTGQGVGFADLARIGALIADMAGPAPDCRAAITAIAQHAPRITVGYDDFTAHRVAFGMVVELAAGVLADARGLTGSLAGLDRVLGQKSAMVMAFAGNIEHGRVLLGRVAGALQQLGQRCQLADLVDGAQGMAGVAARPLPPFLVGVHGGFAVLNNLKMGRHGPESLEGYGAVQADHAGELLKLVTTQLPSFSVAPDGKAHPLPPEIPFPGHVAASEQAIGVGLGPNSATTAVDALQGKPAPAPLMLFAYDYSRIGELILAGQQDPDTESMRALFKAFGLATMQLLIDERGVVVWSSFELR